MKCLVNVSLITYRYFFENFVINIINYVLISIYNINDINIKMGTFRYLFYFE